MRTIKTTGGLTRGRGMTETQRLVWLLSSTACAEVNMAMQEFTSVTYMTSEQHKYISEARQTKDMKDTQEIITFLSTRSPFHEYSTLCNIATGVTADESVDVDCAKQVGDKILNNMMGKSVAQHSFKRKEQVVTLSVKNAVKLKDNVIRIDPQLLFQRLITAGIRHDSLGEVFKYELCSFPPVTV